MKKLLPLFFLAALLVSCIPVDDLDGYWDKGVIDKLLIAKWLPDREFKAHSDSEPLVITSNGDIYTIDSPNERERHRENYKPIYARTLRAGNYLFFMVGPKQGDLLRYVIRDNALEIYTLQAHAMRLLLSQDYPQVKNIQIDECAICRTRSKQDESYDDVKIKLLDDEVFGILSKIPDTPDYWTKERRYIKASVSPR
jgi:hypothetical protein